MSDSSNQDAVRVTAEERPHPALQKLARAMIALARLRHNEQATGQEAHNPMSPPASTETSSSVENGEVGHE